MFFNDFVLIFVIFNENNLIFEHNTTIGGGNMKGFAVKKAISLVAGLCTLYLWATNGLPLVDLVVISVFALLLLSIEGNVNKKSTEEIVVSIPASGLKKGFTIA